MFINDLFDASFKKEIARIKGLQEDAWHDGDNAWSSDKNNWTESSNDPVAVDSTSPVGGEQMLDEYLVRGGEPVAEVLTLNLFQDFDPQDGCAAYFPEFADSNEWRMVTHKYAPIASMLKKKILKINRPLTDAEATAIENTWYDGSDAYDDAEFGYLVDVYNNQIDTLEALIAGNLTDEEFLEGAYDQYDLGTDPEDYEDENEQGFFVCIGNEEDGGFIGMVLKDGGKWREVAHTGQAPHNWGGSYMGYLSPQEVIQWIQKDYGRHAEVKGPFFDEESAKEYAQMQYGLEESSTQRKNSRLWQMITDYERLAKATKNDIKKQHLLTMANELRSKLQSLSEHIVKVQGGYELKSKHGNKNLGKYPTKAGAEKRERQVQYFKHAGESVEEASDDYVPPKEADYDDKYQAMVARVGAKARAQELAKKKKQAQPAPAPVKETAEQRKERRLIEYRLNEMRRAGYFD